MLFSIEEKVEYVLFQGDELYLILKYAKDFMNIILID